MTSHGVEAQLGVCFTLGLAACGDGPKRALRECYDPVAREVADEVWTGYLTPVVAPPGWVMNPDLCPAEGDGECERHSDCVIAGPEDSHFCSLEYLCEPCSGGYWDGEIWHEGCDNLYSFDGSCAPCGEKTEDFRTFEAEKERKQPEEKQSEKERARRERENKFFGWDDMQFPTAEPPDAIDATRPR